MVTRRDGTKVRLPVSSGWEDLKVWRATAAAAARKARIQGTQRGLWRAADFPIDEPVVLTVVYTLQRPTRPTFRHDAGTKPDLDKLDRALHDALAKDANILREDARIVGHLRHGKVYPGEDVDALPHPGALVTIWRLATPGSAGIPLQRAAPVRLLAEKLRAQGGLDPDEALILAEQLVAELREAGHLAVADLRTG